MCLQIIYVERKHNRKDGSINSRTPVFTGSYKYCISPVLTVGLLLKVDGEPCYSRVYLVTLIFGSCNCCIAIMISITTVIQIQADSFVSDTNGFINFLLWSMATRGVRHNHTMLSHPNARRILSSQFISGGRDPKNSNARLNSRKINCTVNNRILNFCLFKILRFSGPSLLGVTSSTLQPHFRSGVYYHS